MRIRTDGDYAYREDAIEGISEFYAANKTKSVVSAAEDLPKLVDAVLDVLEREDLTHSQRQEIVETLSTRHIGFEVHLSEGELEAAAEIRD